MNRFIELLHALFGKPGLAGAFVFVQETFADAQTLRRNFQQLVIVPEQVARGSGLIGGHLHEDLVARAIEEHGPAFDAGNLYRAATDGTGNQSQ